MVWAYMTSFQEVRKDDHSLFERGKGNSCSVEVFIILKVDHMNQQLFSSIVFTDGIPRPVKRTSSGSKKSLGTSSEISPSTN